MSLFLSNFLQLSEIAQAVYFLVIGLCIGSFANVVIYRVPIILKESWIEDSYLTLNHFGKIKENPVEKSSMSMKGRSKCPSCKKTIPWHNNIPVLSWLALRGKSSCCSQKISLRYPLIELAYGIFFSISWVVLPTESALASCFIFTILMVISSIDLEHELIPDFLSVTLLWAGLLVNTGLGGESDFLYAAAFSYCTIFLLNFLTNEILNKDAFGMGDAKLLAAGGAWLGMMGVSMVFIISPAIAIIHSAIVRERRIPFGPSISISIIIIFIYQSLQY